MAFDETLAARIRDALARRRNVEEKKMFGCICFFINGNALVGVWKDRLIARLGPDEGEAALRESHVQAFDITGRPMRNWVAVEPKGVESDDQLKDWIERALKFVEKLPAKEK
jgi:TfoX/Sxy family transcriptional regulator of competence genes